MTNIDKQILLAWRTDFFETNAGMYGTKNNYIRWGEMTGSLVIMDGGIYPTNTVSDAFALVSTNGFNNIPVFYENQLIGKTNNKGYLLIPSMTSWYPTKLTIDPLNLPVDVNISSTNKNLSIPEKSGLLVDFHIELIRSVTLTLVDISNKAIPKGSIIKTNQQQTTWVGINGMVWLQNVKANTLKITVIRADNQALCYLTIQIPPNQNIINMGKHQCQ